MNTMSKTEHIERLIEVMRRLRAPDGCPWDKKQTITSLRPYIIEEAFETVEALDNFSQDDPASVRELVKELGDLLLQVIFVSQIASEEGLFSFEDVAAAIADKLIERHPHVFGDETVKDADDVLAKWNRIKKDKEQKKHLLDGIPTAMPAINLAQRYSSRAASIGFDWPDWQSCVPKVREELKEVQVAAESGDAEEIESEIGDLLFAVVNVARKLGVDSEKALKGTAARFRQRFDVMESLNPSLIDGSLSLDEMEALWQEAKSILKEKKQ